MKNKILCFLLAVTIYQTAFAQSSQTEFPLTAVQGLGTGANWLDPQNVKTNNGASAFCYLDQRDEPNYYSKPLIASNFDFHIPPSAIITGIQVVIRKNADYDGHIKDHSVKIILNNVAVGPNKAKGTFWSHMAFNASYGGPAYLWEQILTDADINSSGFGVFFRCKNMNYDASVGAWVDCIIIKVSYTSGAKLMTQESEIVFNKNELQVFPNPATNNLNFVINSDITNATLKIFNLSGQMVYEYKISELKANESYNISTSFFSNGIYLLQINEGEKTYSRNFVKQ